MEPRYLIGGPTPPERPESKAQKPIQQVEQVKVEITPKVIESKYKGKTAAQWREGGTKPDMLRATLAEQGGYHVFPALFTVMGAYVPEAKLVKTVHGKWVWRIGTGAAAGWFGPSQALSGATRRRNDALKGFRVGQVRARAQVASGMGKHGPYHFIDMVPKAEVEIIDNGTPSMYPDWT